MKAEGCLNGKGFNLETDVLAAKETGCAGTPALRMFASTMLAMGMSGMIVCQFDNTQQQDIAT